MSFLYQPLLPSATDLLAPIIVILEPESIDDGVIGTPSVLKLSESLNAKVGPPKSAPDFVSVIADLRENYFKSVMPKVKIFPLPEDYDTLYLEPDKLIPNEDDGVEINAYIRIDPQQKVLKKYGIEAHRNIMVEIDRNMAEKKDLNPFNIYGSAVFFEGEPYIITEVFEDRFINQIDSTAYVTFGMKLRPSSEHDIEVPDSPTFGQLLGKPSDSNFIAQNQAGYYKVFIEDIDFIKRDPDKNYDTLYLEDVTEYLAKGERCFIPCAVHITENRHRMTKFGLESNRDITLTLPNSILNGLPEYKKQFVKNELGNGTLFVFEKTVYMIVSRDRRNYFGNTDTFLNLIIHGERLRPSSLDSGTVAHYEDQVPSEQQIVKSVNDDDADPLSVYTNG